MDPRESKSFVARLLRQEVVPSTGCTEPAAIAFAAAAASEPVRGRLKRLRVSVDPGTFKNALAVGLPGTHHKGPAVAAAAGAFLANATYGLCVFEHVTPELWEQAANLVKTGKVEVTADGAARGVLIRAEVETSEGSGVAVIEARHNRLVKRFRDGVLLQEPRKESSATVEITDEEIEKRLSSPQAILALMEELDDADLSFVRKGVLMNRKIAEYALADKNGLGFGKALLESPDLFGANPVSVVKGWVAAGVEARMAGVQAPVTTSGGSGNSGIIVTLGTRIAVKELGVRDEERVLHAVALAHLFNVALKVRVGRVGPLCGGAIASSLAVACALTWALGGDLPAIDAVVCYMVTAMTGLLCDGAKPNCAFKIAAGLSAGMDAARLAAAGKLDSGSAGLGGTSGAGAFQRVAKIRQSAFADTDMCLTAILREPVETRQRDVGVV